MIHQHDPSDNWSSPRRGEAVACLTSLPDAVARRNIFAAAVAYRNLGISTIPIKTNGTKEPAISGWREYAGRFPDLDELSQWHSRRYPFGIGITGGHESGNLAVLDFETPAAFIAWGGKLSDDERTALARCPVIGTPRGGAHVYCRLTEPVTGHKLARTVTGETVIEVRGCQHFVVAPGSPPECHPSGRVWHIRRAGWLDGGSWEPMPLETWFSLTCHAADLNEYVRPAAQRVVGDSPQSREVGDRPGDHFNARVRWSDILEPAGWRVFRTSVQTTYWTRPGKKCGVSASTGFCRGPSENDLFFVFSTSAAPFEAEVSYSRFAVYALINHNGDFRAATRALGLAGYGRRLSRLSLDGKTVRL